MSKEINKNLFIILNYVLTSIILEVILFLNLNFGAFPEYFLFDLSFMLIISAIILIIPAYKTKVAVSITLLCIQLILNCANVTIYKIFGDIFTFDMLTLGNEAAAAFSLNFIDWAALCEMLLVVIASIIGFVFTLKFQTYKTTKLQNTSLILAFTFICTFSLGTGLIKIQTNNIRKTSAGFTNEFFESDEYLYNNLNVKVASLKKFGTYGLYITDIYHNIEIKNAQEIENSKNETTKYLTQAQTISELGLTNDFSKISEGNNIITIMVESLEWFAIDDVLTPNLYKLTQNSLNFQSYYARNKTNVSEAIGILGSYPKDTQFSTFYKANSNLNKLDLPFSLPCMLKQKNSEAKTNFFHNYYGYFYGRTSVIPQFGFDNVTCLEHMDAYKNDLPKNFNDFVLDSIMFESLKNKIAPTDGKQFYSHVTTLSMHGGWDFDRPRYSSYMQTLENNWDYITNYINSSGIYKMPTDSKQQQLFKNYKACAMDTDKAIGILLKHLEDNNLLDKTTIIVYGDHNTYLSCLTNIMKNLDITDLFTTELYRIPLMIYDKKAVDLYKAKTGTNVVNSFTTTFNIVPTVMDLIGIDYKPDYYQGNSIFYPNYETGFISIIGGIIDNNFFSYDTKEILYKTPTATKEDLEKYQQNAISFYAKQIHFERIYKYNLFKTLNKSK